MDIEIFYIAYDGIITQSVFDSQVVGFLKKLTKNKDFNINLIGFENLKSFFLQSRELTIKKERIVSNLGIKVTIYPRSPGYIGIYFSILLLLPHFLYRAIRKNKVLFHARGNKAAFMACKIKRFFPLFKVIYDARGVEPEEYVYRKQLQYSGKIFLSCREEKIFYKLKRIEKYIVKNSDKIVCVSNEFRKHYLTKYKILKDKISVFPCCVDTSIFYSDEDVRTKARARMGLKGKLVMIYCGSMKPLQMPKSIIKFFKEIYKLDKEVFFLILTREFERAEEFVQDEGIPIESYKILSVKHSQVPLYLNASDIGIILRDKNIVNRVACPTKFAEYMACGLYIVLTDGIGDISKIVTEKKIGEVLPTLERSEMELASNKILYGKKEIQNSKNRSKISKLANIMFGWDNYVHKIDLLYKELLN